MPSTESPSANYSRSSKFNLISDEQSSLSNIPIPELFHAPRNYNFKSSIHDSSLQKRGIDISDSDKNSSLSGIPTDLPEIRPPKKTSLGKDPAESEVIIPTVISKTERGAPQLNKCRLIAKFIGNSDSGSLEDMASSFSAVSVETPTSNVCPVCRTFTSSSNTTLNVHSPQCLSLEPVPRWAVCSKLMKPRIRHRKTRLMTDIYATATYSTLEELDRRNGTSWASVSFLPSATEETEQEVETSYKYKNRRPCSVDVQDSSYKDKKRRPCAVNVQDCSDVGSVPEIITEVNVHTASYFNGRIEGKSNSMKMKKHSSEKHHKLYKCIQRTSESSHTSHASEGGGPRDVDSEDLQGNSSLTINQVQSSPVHDYDVGHGESPCSPVSSASSFSNPLSAKPDFNPSWTSTCSGSFLPQETMTGLLPRVTTSRIEQRP